MDVSQALRTRSSKRAFLARPVDRGEIEQILQLAGLAPSGSNIQPWHVYVVSGAVRDRLCTEVADAARSARGSHQREYNYYPEPWREPYLARRRACGWGLYSVLGIAKGDRDAGLRQELRNFDFFGAPVGLFFYIERDLQPGSWLDYGMFIQSVMLAAREAGLDTCPQAAWAHFHRIVTPLVGAPAGQMLVCGMALGHADPADPVNAYRPARLAVAEYTRFLGFGDAD
jgi:nitroreductase